MSKRHPAPELPSWIEQMLPEGLQRYRIDVGDGLQMHVMERGSGRPVLMVHGNPTWGFLYRKVVTALSGEEGLRLVIPDLIGLGLSDKPASGDLHDLAHHGAWMRRLVESLDLQGAILVGQDWGGAVGMLGFQGQLERLAGMVVLNTVLGPPRPGFRPTAFHHFATLPVISDLVFKGLAFPQNVMAMAQGDRGSIRGDVARAYRWPLRRFADRAAPLATARMAPNSMVHPSMGPLNDVRRMVKLFSGPAAIVWGRRDPILGKLLRRIQRQLPQAETTVTEAGHFLQEEVPEEIAAAIRSVAAQLAV